MAVKSQYEAPKLAVYGGFAQLTAAGSITTNEGGANQGPRAKAMARP